MELRVFVGHENAPKRELKTPARNERQPARKVLNHKSNALIYTLPLSLSQETNNCTTSILPGEPRWHFPRPHHLSSGSLDPSQTSGGTFMALKPPPHELFEFSR